MKPWHVALGAIVVFVAVYLAFPPHVFGQQSTYYTDGFGRPVGQAWTYGNQTFYTDVVGRPVGSVATNGPLQPQALGIPTPIQPEPFRIEPIRPIEPLQPLRMQ